MSAHTQTLLVKGFRAEAKAHCSVTGRKGMKGGGEGVIGGLAPAVSAAASSVLMYVRSMVGCWRIGNCSEDWVYRCG